MARMVIKMGEIWKPLVYRGEDFGDTFEVSNKGKIRNHKTGLIRKMHTNHEGYLYCVISRGRKRKVAVKAHRAVAENFVSGDKTLVVDHIDGNKLNNNADNLEFVTYKENNNRAARMGLMPYYRFSLQDIQDIKIMRNNGITITEIARRYNVSRETVGRMLRGESYRAII
jgi:DNA-binding CsgD family transcriptional regulator